MKNKAKLLHKKHPIIIANIFAIIALLSMIACEQNNLPPPLPTPDDNSFIVATDISSYPEIATSNPIYYNLNGEAQDYLDILKDNGINTIRLRLWVNPNDEHSSFNEVKAFSNTLKSKGFKTWLTLHYSDTWADPGNQITPAQWQNLDFNSLRDSVFQYTQRVVSEMQPHFIQIGNEINTGFLHPQGHIVNYFQDFKALMTSGIEAVRTQSDSTQIMIHFAGIDDSDWFFEQVSELDYDIMGLSYYPIWHGKSLDSLQNQLQYLSETHNKNVLIAETAYPFTLAWNDWTNNIVGLEEQLILPEFPATPEGQEKFIQEVHSLVKEVENGIGFCYWGAELTAWKGQEATDASPWENQALFDFEHQALPVLRAFEQ